MKLHFKVLTQHMENWYWSWSKPLHIGQYNLACACFKTMTGTWARAWPGQGCTPGAVGIKKLFEKLKNNQGSLTQNYRAKFQYQDVLGIYSQALEESGQICQANGTDKSLLSIKI